MLSNNWFIEGNSDFEYKKYILLGYLQDVKKHFDQKKLYPHLGDLINQYSNLQQLKGSHANFQETLPNKIDAIDLNKLKVIYQPITDDDKILTEIFEIINYAIPTIEPVVEFGKEIYDFIENSIIVEPVGVLPLYKKEGYFMMSYCNDKTVKIYRYEVGNISWSDENYVTIRTEFIRDERTSLVNHVANIKGNLIKTHPELPNPATYFLHTNQKFPFKQSLIPISERIIMKQVAA